MRISVKIFLSLFLLASAGSSIAQQGQQQSPAPVWVADNGDGTYRNPIIHADYSDPDIIRVGDDYYMTASSFNCIPGLPILHSKDMVNWTIVNYAIQGQLPEKVYNIPQHGKGVWAPSWQYHNKKFYIYYGDPDFGVYRVEATNPQGKWGGPVLVLPAKGIIDPSVFWDDDGKCYMAVGWAASRAGVNSLLTLFELNGEGTKAISGGRHIYDGHGLDHTVEGPKIYKRNGEYYILAPAGGVATGWQIALRSKDIYGPYQRKVVLQQGVTDVNGPHQGALVQTPAGKDWFYHFQDRGAYGRIVHLQPVSWKDGWPVVGEDKDGDGVGEPVAQYKKPLAGKNVAITKPQEYDAFDSDTLGLQWQWQANAQIGWASLIKGRGFLRLFAIAQPAAAENLFNAPNLLLQKFPAPDFSATTKLTYHTEWEAWQNKKVGLVVLGDDYAYLAISKDSMGFKLTQAVCMGAVDGNKEEVMPEIRLKDSTVYIRVTVNAPDAACRFFYAGDGKNFQAIGEPFTAKTLKWMGAKLGLFCVAKEGVRVGGYVDVDWFSIHKTEGVE